jgi:hypothetical protein
MHAALHRYLANTHVVYVLRARALCKACVCDIDACRQHHKGQVQLRDLLPRRKYFRVRMP